MGLIRIIQGDIMRIPVDAVVLAGRGSDTIRSAGQAVLEKCETAPVKHIIRTKRPEWKGGQHDEDRLLALCYRNILKLAAENGLKTVAFPSFEQDGSNYPLRRAARIALLEISDFLEEYTCLEKVFVVCGDDDTVKLTNPPSKILIAALENKCK